MSMCTSAYFWDIALAKWAMNLQHCAYPYGHRPAPHKLTMGDEKTDHVPNLLTGTAFISLYMRNSKQLFSTLLTWCKIMHMVRHFLVFSAASLSTVLSTLSLGTLMFAGNTLSTCRARPQCSSWCSLVRQSVTPLRPWSHTQSSCSAYFWSFLFSFFLSLPPFLTLQVHLQLPSLPCPLLPPSSEAPPIYLRCTSTTYLRSPRAIILNQ